MEFDGSRGRRTTIVRELGADPTHAKTTSSVELVLNRDARAQARFEVGPSVGSYPDSASPIVYDTRATHPRVRRTVDSKFRPGKWIAKGENQAHDEDRNQQGPGESCDSERPGDLRVFRVQARTST